MFKVTGSSISGIGNQSPTLGQLTFQQAQAGLATLTFNASAPGADFGVKGKECSPVSVFVNGQYFSSEAIIAERNGPGGVGQYTVNLGNLPKGTYSIELRAATQMSPTSPVAVVQPGSMRVGAPAGDPLALQVSRFEPVFVTRRNDPGFWQNVMPVGSADPSDTRPLLAHSDVPLEMRGEVIGDPSGVHVIRYHVTFSDEDGGTPDAERMKTYHRTTDDEWCYAVAVNPDGTRVTPEQFAQLKQAGALPPAVKTMFDQMGSPEVYQYGEDGNGQIRHQQRAYAGMHDGDRPVIVDNSSNNNFDQVTSPDQILSPIWSPTVSFDESRVQRDAQGNITQIGAQSDLDVIAQNPWMQQISTKEIAREPNDQSVRRTVDGWLDTAVNFIEGLF